MAELTEVGAAIEALRRRQTPRMSNEKLAQASGMSRQHLWRGMTGAATFDIDELGRIAKVLGVPRSALLPEDDGNRYAGDVEESEPSAGSGELADYVSNLERIQRTLKTYPGGDSGHALKVGFLNMVERAAKETGNKLPPEYWQIRRRVHEGEL